MFCILFGLFSMKTFKLKALLSCVIISIEPYRLIRRNTDSGSDCWAIGPELTADPKLIWNAVSVFLLLSKYLTSTISASFQSDGHIGIDNRFYLDICSVRIFASARGWIFLSFISPHRISVAGSKEGFCWLSAFNIYWIQVYKLRTLFYQWKYLHNFFRYYSILQSFISDRL